MGENYWTSRSGLSRRRFVGGSALAAVGAASLGLVGCGGDDDDGENGNGNGNQTGQTPGGSTSTPKKGGTLSLPGVLMTEPFDPGTVAARQAPMWNMIADGALEMDDKNYKVTAGMFEAWETPSPDQVTLKMRQGMTWHDIEPVSGRAVTAQDLAKAISYHAGLLKLAGYEGKAFQRRGNFVGMESATATDDSTVVLKMKSPSSAISYGLADYRVKMFPQEQLDLGFSDSNKLIGSGPFMLKPGFANPKEYGSPYSVTKNPKYRDSALPNFDQIDIKYIVDPAAQDSALVAGTIDALSLVNRPDVQVQALAKQSNKLKLVSWDYAYWHWLLFNMKRSTWQDKKVRKAIQLALDYQALGKGFYGDQWSYSGSLPAAYRQEAIQSDKIKAMAGWNPATKDADRKEALALMSSAGYPDGRGLNVTALIFSHGPHFANATRVKDQLEGVFKEMKIELVAQDDSAAFFSRTAEGNYDWNFYGIFPTTDPTLHLIGSYSTSGGRNYGKYENPQVDQLLTQALGELNPEAKNAKLMEVQNILNEDLPYITLYTANLAAIMNSDLKGFEGDNRPGPGTTSYHIEQYARYMSRA
jgi:peptide/nickel transport system substrate-binding protein